MKQVEKLEVVIRLCGSIINRGDSKDTRNEHADEVYVILRDVIQNLGKRKNKSLRDHAQAILDLIDNSDLWAVYSDVKTQASQLVNEMGQLTDFQIDNDGYLRDSELPISRRLRKQLKVIQDSGE